MNWSRLLEDSPATFIQRGIKIMLIKADRGVTGIKMAIAKMRHREDFVLKDVQGSKIFLNIRDDKGLSSELYLNGIREAHATVEFQKRLKSGQVIADIGANIGYYVLMEAKAVGPKGKVYAIEPIIGNVELLKKNIDANNYKNIEVFNKAVGDKNGKQDIFVSKQSNLSTFCKNIDLDQTGETVPVEVTTLDSFLKDKRLPDIVRMDVEGYEFEILKGMKKTFKETGHLQLFIEVHCDFLGVEKTKEFYRLLKKHGVRKCLVVWESMDILKFSKKILSKNVLSEQGRFERTIDEMIAEDKFHHGVYHLFADT